MNQVEKYKRLKELIEVETPFAIESQGVLELNLSFGNLEDIGFSLSSDSNIELKKCLNRLVSEGGLISFEPHLDLELSIIKGGVSHYDGYSLFLPVSAKNRYHFDTNSGDFTKGDSTVNFKPNTKQYLFMKLLNSKPGKLYLMQDILDEVYGEGKSLRGYQKNIYDLVDKIKLKLSLSGIKDIIDTSKNGYRLKIS